MSAIFVLDKVQHGKWALPETFATKSGLGDFSAYAAQRGPSNLQVSGQMG